MKQSGSHDPKGVCRVPGLTDGRVISLSAQHDETPHLRKAAASLLLAALASTSVFADHSTVELATGGLFFADNDRVEIRSESLFIATREIKVIYRLFNKSGNSETVHMEFPMPEIRVDGSAEDIAVPTQDPENILGFAITANGAPIASRVEQKASAQGVDQTALLRSLGIPLAPHLQLTSEALDRQPRPQWAELVRLGLAAIMETENSGQGPQQHLSPRWTLRTTYAWDQEFPAQAELELALAYKPSVGESVETALGAPSATGKDWFGAYKQKYCLDADFVASVDSKRAAAGNQFGAPYSEARITYQESTAAKRSQSVHLVVDKGDPNSLVSFCGEDIKKIGPTQFAGTAIFKPDGSFSVLILKNLPPREE